MGVVLPKVVQNGRSEGGAALVALGRGHSATCLRALGDHKHPKHPKVAEIGSFLAANVEFGGPGSPALVAQHPLGMIGGMTDP